MEVDNNEMKINQYINHLKDENSKLDLVLIDSVLILHEDLNNYEKVTNCIWCCASSETVVKILDDREKSKKEIIINRIIQSKTPANICYCNKISHLHNTTKIYLNLKQYQFTLDERRHKYYFKTDCYEFAIKVMLGVAKGLKFLHDLFIVHRNINLDNIMLNSQNDAYIIDFGSAVYVGALYNRREYSNSTTIGYNDPFTFTKYECTFDIFSYGKVLDKLLNYSINETTKMQLLEENKNQFLQYNLLNDVKVNCLVEHNRWNLTSIVNAFMAVYPGYKVVMS